MGPGVAHWHRPMLGTVCLSLQTAYTSQKPAPSRDLAKIKSAIHRSKRQSQLQSITGPNQRWTCEGTRKRKHQKDVWLTVLPVASTSSLIFPAHRVLGQCLMKRLCAEMQSDKMASIQDSSQVRCKKQTHWSVADDSMSGAKQVLPSLSRQVHFGYSSSSHLVLVVNGVDSGQSAAIKTDNNGGSKSECNFGLQLGWGRSSKRGPPSGSLEGDASFGEAMQDTVIYICLSAHFAVS